jgi:hypothetical protein
MQSFLRTVRDWMTARRELGGLELRHHAAVRAADEAGYRMHTERLALLAALTIEPMGPLSAARRVDLEVRQGALALEVMACRHAANRARAALGIIRSQEFRRWYTGLGVVPAGDVAVVSAFCAAYPGDPGVLGLSVRTELVPIR